MSGVTWIDQPIGSSDEGLQQVRFEAWPGGRYSAKNGSGSTGPGVGGLAVEVADGRTSADQIGILGGSVGSGVVRVLESNAEAIAHKAGADQSSASWCATGEGTPLETPLVTTDAQDPGRSGSILCELTGAWAHHYVVRLSSEEAGRHQ